MKGTWEGIPGSYIDDPTAVDGQRWVVRRHALERLRMLMCGAAGCKCSECGTFCPDGDRHHIYGRGAGGSKCEDRDVVLGVRMVIWICRRCHSVAVIKPWGSWKDIDKSVSAE